MRLEISGGPLGVKFRVQGYLGVGKGEKHPLGQNCPKADATIKEVSSRIQEVRKMIFRNLESIALLGNNFKASFKLKIL